MCPFGIILDSYSTVSKVFFSKNFVFIIKPCSTNLKSKQKTGNKQHEVLPPAGGVQSSANKLNVKL